jgi:hypothetical protein
MTVSCRAVGRLALLTERTSGPAHQFDHVADVALLSGYAWAKRRRVELLKRKQDQPINCGE